MLDELKVLQLNVGKRQTVQHSLLNDTTLQDYLVLVTLEPYIYGHPDTQTPKLSYYYWWNSFTPSVYREDGATRHKFRSAIWVRHNIETTQLRIPFYDIVGVITWVPTYHGRSAILHIAAYDPRDTTLSSYQRTDLLQSKLDAIRQTIQEQETLHGPDLPILLYTDFNRHDPLWTGTRLLQQGREQEAAPILSLIQAAQLAVVLPSGTITWEHQTTGDTSTNDVLFATHSLLERAIKRQLHAIDHGSDHNAINFVTPFTIQEVLPSHGRFQLQRADWPSIRQDLTYAPRLQVGWQKPWTTPTDLDDRVADFTDTVNQTIRRHIPRTKYSPYTKRWWSPELTILRHSMTSLRNGLTRARRRGGDVEGLTQQYHIARTQYHKAILSQKKTYWQDFISDANNIWKANQYTKGLANAKTIPLLRSQGVEYHASDDKAQILLESFFPPLPPRQETMDEALAYIVRAPPTPQLMIITEEEARYAIFSSNPKKAGGPDDITFEVWRQLWPTLKPWILRLWQTSLSLAYHPRQWRVARIIALRKPNKTDYTAAKAYRPISLLPTISKGLEVVVARKLSYFAETHALLPPNHFGARPKRSSEQALNLIIERIHQAWQSRKILSLVTFNVKGAFNGVCPHILEERLVQRQVPPQLAKMG